MLFRRKRTPSGDSSMEKSSSEDDGDERDDTIEDRENESCDSGNSDINVNEDDVDKNSEGENDNIVNSDDDENEESNVKDSVKNKEITQDLGGVQEIYQRGNKFFPGRLKKLGDTKIKCSFRSFNRNKKLALKVKTDLGDTWLGKPGKNGGDKDTKCWNVKQLEFKKNHFYVPEGASAQHPRKIAIHFSDEKESSFFADQSLVINKKIVLNSSIFSPNKVNLDSEFTRTEAWSRQGVRESETLNSLLEVCADTTGGLTKLLNDIREKSGEKNCDEDWEKVSENLNNLHDFIDLAKQTNYRAKSYAIATCTKSKQELRKDVLGKYNGEVDIKEKLLCSNFSNDSLFGPIPKRYYSASNSCSNKKPPLTLKKSPNNSTNSSQQGKKDIPPKKKPRNDWNNTNYFDRSNYQGFNPNWDRYANKALFREAPKRGGRQKGRGRGRGSRGS